jgi:hypothetical protein
LAKREAKEEDEVEAMEDVRIESKDKERESEKEEEVSMIVRAEATTVFEGHGGEVFVGSWWNGVPGNGANEGGYLATG